MMKLETETERGEKIKINRVNDLLGEPMVGGGGHLNASETTSAEG